MGDAVWSAGLAPVNPDESFLDAVTAGRTGGPDFDDALRAHTVVDAAYRSAAPAAGPRPSRPGSDPAGLDRSPAPPRLGPSGGQCRQTSYLW